MTKPKNIRFGFIGAGQIAYSAADGVKRNPNATLFAAFDPNAERLEAFAKAKGIPKTCATAEALFAEKDLDAVYIATPNKFHVPLAKQALQAGKHVILEKPFAMNYKEAKEAAELANQLGLTFMIGMNQRFTPDSQRIKALVEAGTLGDIYHAKAYWRRRSGIPSLGTWFSSHELAGGGALYDIGVHMLDLCLYTIDNYEPVSVSGATYTQFGNRGLGQGTWGMSEKTDIAFDVDDVASAFIRFANGATVTLDATWAGHMEKPTHENVEIFGTEAGATLRPAKLFRFGGADSLSKYEIIDVDKPALKWPHANRFENFINHLVGSEELCVSLDQALVVQRILDAIALSSKLGREVLISEIN